MCFSWEYGEKWNLAVCAISVSILHLQQALVMCVEIISCVQCVLISLFHMEQTDDEGRTHRPWVSEWSKFDFRHENYSSLLHKFIICTSSCLSSNKNERENILQICHKRNLHVQKILMLKNREKGSKWWRFDKC